MNVSSKEFAGVNVTLILNGEFDMGAQKTVYLIAPSATTAGGSIANLAIATNTNDDVSFGAGSNSIVTGMIHAPNSAVSVTGGAALSGGGGCFMLVADTVTLNGSGVGATICPGVGGGNSAEVMLLQ